MTLRRPRDPERELGGRYVRSGVFFTLVGLATGGSGAAGQQIPVEPPSVELAALPPISISPGGAFLRALIVPGWGHAAIGSYTRGGFYFGAQSAIVYTLLRTRIRIGEARERVQFHEAAIRSQLAANGVTDPDAIQQGLDEDAGLGEVRELLDSREAQREDMVAVGLFFMLIGGVDAYISAHLARFPEPLEVEARPVGDGRVEVTFRLKLPN